MSELQVKDLESDSAQARLTAAGAIADAVERGTPLGDAVGAIIGLFADTDERVRGMATYILQTDVDRDAAGGTLPALRTAVSNDRAEIRRGAAFLLAGCLARQEDAAAIAALLEQPDPVVRLSTLGALASGFRAPIAMR